MKPQRIAVETLTLKELSKLFRDSVMIGLPRAEHPIRKTFNDLNRAKISSYQWIKSYEIFKGAKLNFYCRKVPGIKSAQIAIGMTHRTSKGMVLLFLDTTNGGLTDFNPYLLPNEPWDGWLLIYTSHCCERFAKRIMKSPEVTFKIGSDGIMFSDMRGQLQVEREKIFKDVDEVTFQFQDGQAYGYRDRKNKVTLFRTIYSNDMLKGKHLELFNEWKSTEKELTDFFSLD